MMSSMNNYYVMSEKYQKYETNCNFHKVLETLFYVAINT